MIQEVIAGAVIVERTTEIVKALLPEKVGAFKNGLYISSALGIFVCLVFKIDFLTQIGLTSGIVGVGEVFTGLLMTGGAAMFHSILAALKPKAEVELVLDIEGEVE